MAGPAAATPDGGRPGPARPGVAPRPAPGACGPSPHSLARACVRGSPRGRPGPGVPFRHHLPAWLRARARDRASARARGAYPVPGGVCFGSAPVCGSPALVPFPGPGPDPGLAPRPRPRAPARAVSGPCSFPRGRFRRVPGRRPGRSAVPAPAPGPASALAGAPARHLWPGACRGLFRGHALRRSSRHPAWGLAPPSGPRPVRARREPVPSAPSASSATPSGAQARGPARPGSPSPGVFPCKSGML